MSTTKQKVHPMSNAKKQAQHDAHRDPLSGRAGAHPVGTGVGAVVGGVAGGAMTGAAMGAAAGPVGVVAGAAVGAAVGVVSGGMAGKLIAEEVNPTVEHGYWRQHHANCNCSAKSAIAYAEYAPAYQYGWEAQARYLDKTFEQMEATLQRDWDKVKGASKLGWAEAKHAVRDSWNRVAKSHPKRQ